MQQNQEYDLLILFQHYLTDKIQRKDILCCWVFFFLLNNLCKYKQILVLMAATHIKVKSL